MSIRPSALGGKGLLLFVALELAFLATRYSNLFFLMLAFCAVTGALGLFWSWRNLRDVAVTRVELPAAPQGAPREVAVHLAARGGTRPRFDLGVELDTGGGPQELAWCDVLVGEARVRGELAALERGVLPVGHLRVASRFPFGLVRAIATLPVTAELITYPAPAGEARGQAGAGEGDGDGDAPHPGRGAALAGLREFRSGDAIADVHWKATARRGVAVVKEREHDRPPEAVVVVDRRVAPEALERSLARATAAVLLARRSDRPVRLCSQGLALLVDPDGDRDATPKALRWLAAAQPLPEDAPAPDAPRPGRGAAP